MLNINEIFRSIDGEVNAWGQGTLTTFIRLQGCNCHCEYCDTKHVQNIKTIKYEMSVSDICELIPEGKVTITGGEPLLQDEVYPLIEQLINQRHFVSVETNGSKLIKHYYQNSLNPTKKLSWIVDYKLHAEKKMKMDNFWRLTSNDWIKFVIQNDNDFKKAVTIYRNFVNQGCRARFAFSPVIKKNKKTIHWLADKMIQAKLYNISFNLQIHKLIWPNKSEGISLLSKINLEK